MTSLPHDETIDSFHYNGEAVFADVVLPGPATMSWSVVFSVTIFPRVLHLWSAVSIAFAVCSSVVATALGATEIGTTAAYSLFGADSLDARLRLAGTLRTECCLHRWSSF
jgi:hypothetical protein